jgi:hypothetical protein
MSSGDWNAQNCWVIGFNKQNTSISCPVNGYNRGLIPSGFTLTNNKWYHLATVYDNGTSYAYLDGELIGSITSPGIYQSSSTTACIGRDQGHGGFFPYNGDINDLRIYDHALSQAEIKELSKALVMHYTFDDVCTEPTTNLVTGLVKGGRTTLDSTGKVITTNGEDGDTYFYLNLSKTLEAGKTYTISCTGENIIQNSGGSGEFFQFGLQGQGGVPQFKIYNGRSSATFTATTTQAVNRLLLDDITGARCLTQSKFYDFQLEEHDHATPYTSTSRESMLHNETGLIQPNHKANLQLTHDAGSGIYSLKCAGSTAINTPVTGDISQGATAAF